ncbi:MAG: flagellar basal body rod protein FlgC [Oscillospiraceae bacterium]|nr:flagellar basal body rod protein FlgC [Oscillospiraceae bacterium]MCI8761493.1 flagellar basal body rod protein FlgC [Oscillospiraceae bacterium]
MAFMNTINIIGSGLTAQQLRLDIVSENVTNSQTTRVENGEGAYRRKMVVFEAVSGRNSFREALARAASGMSPEPNTVVNPTAGGVRVTEIVEDESPMRMVYDPTHPDADEQGYLELPNVDMVLEIADAMAASRAFASNVTAFNTLKSVISSGLEIGR